MKRIMVFLIVLAVAATLFAGCAQSGAPSPMPDQTTPETAPIPEQTTPEPTPTPGLTTPDGTPAPGPTAPPSSPEASTGTIRVLVTDDPPDYTVTGVVIHFTEVWVHKAADGQDGKGEWVQLTITDGTFEPGWIDLAQLMDDEAKVTLVEEDIEEGKYTQIRLIIDEPVKVAYTYTGPENPENDEETETEVHAKLPSGKLKFVRPFEVAEGAETEILLDFDLEKSVVFTGATVFNEDTQQYEAKVIVKPVVKLQVTILGGECDTDAELILENKDSDNDWEIIDDEIYGVLQYSTEGDMFCYDFRGYSLEDTDYSLIYYADYEDRFTNWGGDNPGALIASGTVVDGTLSLVGSVNLREDLDADGIDLPCPPDSNIDVHDYSGPPDNYDHAHGAKIWLVPSECYDSTNFRIYEDKWQPDRFLFETDLITFDDTDNEYEPLG